MASRAVRRTGQILTGLAALICLLAIAAGAPAALIWLGGNPLPGHLPTLTALSDLLTRPDDGTTFLATITVLGWIAWAWFTIPVIIEAIARLRGVRTPRLRAFTTPQKVAAGLLTAIGLLTSSPALAAATPGPAYATPLTTSTAVVHHTAGPATPASPAGPHHAAHTTPASQQAPGVYRVAPGDRLAAIADRFLADDDRYPEIAHANPALERRDHRFPDHIEPGWTIRLPAGAQDHGSRDHAHGTVLHPAPKPQPATPGAPGTTGQVSGQDEAGPAGATAPPPATIAPASTPGTGPATAATSMPVPSAAATSTGAPSKAATTPTAPTAAATAARPAHTAASGPASTPAAGPSAAPDQPAAPAAPAAESSDAVDAAITGTLAGAGILAALLLSILYRRRTRQRQHRRTGRRLPHPAAGATEQALLAAAQPADVDRLDAALHHLAASLAGYPVQNLPDIAGAWITTGHDQHGGAPVISLILTRACPNPPAPWLSDGTHWILPADVDLDPSAEHFTPLPALVTVGSQPGQHLLLDLERLGRVTVVGTRANTSGLLRYLITELACNRWSDDADITSAGLPEAETVLLAALNPDRIQATTDIPAACARIRRRITTVTTTLHDTGTADTLTGRLTDTGEAWAPRILLVADPDAPARTALDDLGTDLTAAGRCAAATVVATTTVSSPGHDQHTLTLLDNGVLQISLAAHGTPFLATEIRAATLPVAELAPLAEIMTQARAATDEPVPPAAEPEPWALGADAAGGLLPHHLFTAAPDPTTVPAGNQDQPAAPAAATPVDAQPAPGQPAIHPVPALETTACRDTRPVPPQHRSPADPDLDADLQAWHDQDPTRPLVSILGPVTVTAPGTEPDRRRFYAEIIVLLTGRGTRGITGDQISEALWPNQKVSPSSRRVAITRVRRWLGETPTGEQWLPEMGSDRLYRLTPGVLLDWHLFRRARTRGEALGPAGIPYLRAALDLVHGTPLDGADRAYAVGARTPYAWLPESELYPGHIVSAIVDTAHRLAELYLDSGDHTNARWAVQQAWTADPDRGDDGPWQDLMRIEHAAGHLAELRNLVGELMRARDAEYPEDLASSTYTWLRTLAPDLLSTGTFTG